MENPWVGLPAIPPYVLPVDEDVIAAHNLQAKMASFIHLDSLPEPFLGRPNAPVLLLGLNPGHSQSDAQQHADPVFSDLSRRNLVHGLDDYPFYLLHPSIHKSPGAGWWRQRLGHILDRYPRDQVANSILCVEYFPYHSRHYGMQNQAPSQAYSWHLVRKAVRRGALIIALRSAQRWKAAVPELEGYWRFHVLRSPQNPTITNRNLPSAFEELVALVSGGARND